MSKIFRLASKLVATVMLGCLAQSSFATHFQGGDLTYQCVAPGVYVVKSKIYRDCSGAGAPTSITLDLKSPGCNAGRSINVPASGNPRVGDPYCPQIPKTCSATGRPNYEEIVFSTTVTFSAAEQACPNWVFSVTNSARPEIANLQNSQGNIYYEAYVNLGPASSGMATTINNSSPEFSTLNVPIPFVCVGQDTRYSLNASETDGDSLSYELVAPLNAASTPYSYASTTGQAGVLINPKDSTQIAFMPLGTQLYSPTYPLPSYSVDWTKPAPRYATPYFKLNPLNGELSFRPAVYYPSASSLGKNKYAVVVKISEWRKINGVVTLVGSIRRDILFIVEDCAGNNLPVSTAPPAKPIYHAQFKNDTVFNVQTCNTTPILIHFIDKDTIGNQLTVTFDQTALATIPNKQFVVYNNKTDHVTAKLFITPDVSEAGKDYYLPVRIEDNACPIKGIVNQVYTIHVQKQDLAEINGNKMQTICLGESAKLDVFVNRPDSAMATPVQATTKLDTVHYSYEWTPAPGLNNAELNNKIVTVTPTVTTRYNVKISSSGTCYDTTSVLVKVDENPIISSIKVGYGLMGGLKAGDDQIRFGSYAPLNVTMGNSDTTGFTYSWTPSTAMYKNVEDMKAGKIDTTDMNPIVGPLKTTVYTLTVKNSSGQCISEEKVTANVGPFFLPNIITPNNDGNNDYFEFRGIEPKTSVQIFNRWGVKVQEYKSYNNEFDGKDVADGTYYYLVKEPNGKSYKGWFEIVH